MREPPPTSYETMLATCKDPGALRPAAERAATAMAVTTTTADNTTESRSACQPSSSSLADYASHDEQGYHVRAVRRLPPMGEAPLRRARATDRRPPLPRAGAQARVDQP